MTRETIGIGIEEDCYCGDCNGTARLLSVDYDEGSFDSAVWDTSGTVSLVLGGSGGTTKSAEVTSGGTLIYKAVPKTSDFEWEVGGLFLDGGSSVEGTFQFLFGHDDSSNHWGLEFIIQEFQNKITLFKNIAGARSDLKVWYDGNMGAGTWDVRMRWDANNFSWAWDNSTSRSAVVQGYDHAGASLPGGNVGLSVVSGASHDFSWITVGTLGDGVMGKSTDATSVTLGIEDACMYISCQNTWNFRAATAAPVAGTDCKTVTGTTTGWTGSSLVSASGSSPGTSAGSIIFGKPHHYFTDIVASDLPQEGYMFSEMTVQHGKGRLIFNAIDLDNCWIVECDCTYTINGSGNVTDYSHTIKLIRRASGSETVKDTATDTDTYAAGIVDVLVLWSDTTVRAEVGTNGTAGFLYVQDDSPTLFTDGVEFGCTLQLHAKATGDNLTSRCIVEPDDNTVIEATDCDCDLDPPWVDDTGFD